MELEFDKEIDAMLRRSATRGAPARDTAKLHLDADAIAAFAENALPEKSRRIYTEHLAECDPCRKTLSSLILMNAEAESELAAAAVAPILPSLPWYRKFFTTPQLAYTFGGLILFFGGLIGFVVFQSYSDSTNTVSMVEEPQAARPYSAPNADSAAAPNSNASANAANTSGNAAGEIPRALGTIDDSQPEKDAILVSPPPPMPMLSAPATGTASNSAANTFATDGINITGGQPAAKEVAKSADESRMRVEDKRALNEREERKQDADAKDMREQQLNQRQVQMMPDAGNSKNIGPNRSGVQRDNRGYDDSSAMKAKKAEAPATASRADSASGRRTVGGKTFEFKQGAWYDTAYRGQSTKNVRRGTDDYRKLDGGLRSIADSIGGLVVVVWNGKAYRIQ